MKVRVVVGTLLHDILGKLVKDQVLNITEPHIYKSLKNYVEVIDGKAETKVEAKIHEVEYDTKVVVQKAKTKIASLTKGDKK